MKLGMNSILIGTALILGLSSCTKKEASDEIVIGHFASLTGNIANFGQSERKGTDLALKQINAAGGINGKKVKIVTYDDQGKPEEVQTAVTKLITQDNVLAIIGEVASSLSLVAADVAMRNKTPMISPSSTNPAVTQKGEYIFRICFIDPFQGEVMAQFAHDRLKAKTAAILRDVKNDYSVGLANFFTKAFEASGGKIVLDTSYQEKDVDFKAQLTDIKAKKPDVIFVPGYYNEVALIARQGRALGITQPLLGGDGWESEDLFKVGGAAVNGSYYSSHYSPDTKDPVTQKFIADFKAEYGSTPDSMAALGYDAFNVMMNAIKNAKAINREEIKNALALTKDFSTATGKITINSERNAVKSAVVLKITDGKAGFDSLVEPKK